VLLKKEGRNEGSEAGRLAAQFESRGKNNLYLKTKN
jgi:hypothetical protein